MRSPPPKMFSCCVSAFSSSPTFSRAHILLSRSYSVKAYQKTKSPVSSLSSSSSYRSHQDEESRAVKVSVWWDFHDCSIPDGVEVFRVAQRITAALRANGIKGPVNITAYGDVSVLTRANQEALSATGISFNHIPHGGKNATDRSLLIDLVYWASQNPPPAHLFLISGDRDFANILHRLRMSNYNILLASTDVASGVLCSAASIMWNWNGLVRGDCLTGKHFNHPPDGSHASWYGRYKGPLEDPFADMEPELFSEESPDQKLRPIPKPLVNRIRQILDSYPNGLTIGELHKELLKSNLAMDKDFFGYKKLSRFLLALPHVFKIRNSPSDTDNLVQRLHSKALVSGIPLKSEVECSKLSVEVSTGAAETDRGLPIEGLEIMSKEKLVSGQPLDSKTKQLKMGESGARREDNLENSASNTNRTSPKEFEPKEVKLCLGHCAVDSQSSSEDGIFKKMQRILFGLGSVNLIEKSTILTKDIDIKKVCSEKVESTGKHEHLSNADLVGDKHTICMDGKGSTYKSFFGKLIRWSKFTKFGKPASVRDSCCVDPLPEGQGQDQHGLNEKETFSVNSQLSKRLPEADSGHELFSKDYFWEDLESFFHTTKGSITVSLSRTRDQLAQKLQKEGPLIMKTFSPSELEQLVDILISKKKWVAEFSHLKYPFTLVLPSKQLSSESNANVVKGLSSIFSKKSSNASLGGNLTSKAPQNLVDLKGWLKKFQHGAETVEVEDFKRYFQRDFGKKLDSGYYGFATAESLLEGCSSDCNGVAKGHDKPHNKSKQEILFDCEKLLVEILNKHPEGFNVGSFKRLFHEKYGYHLHYQKLGFPKVVYLLKTFPGVCIEKSIIFPAVNGMKTHSLGETITSEQEDRPKKSSSLEEVADSSIRVTGDAESDSDSGATDVTCREIEHLVDFNEVSSVSEGNLSDSDGEKLILDKRGERKPELRKESSLLEILDSWQSTKNSEDKRNTGYCEDLDGFVNCSMSSNWNHRDLSNSKSENSSRRMDKCQKYKPHKKYSFVLDSRSDDKDRLIDSILGNLKKSGDVKVQS